MNDLQISTIKEIVTNDYRTAAVFEKYSLDFCCGGGKTIEQACKEKSINPSIVLAEIKSTLSGAMKNGSAFTAMELDELIEYIVRTHHAYVISALPAIQTHTLKVASVHGERHPEVITIAQRFAVVAGELQNHMLKEERILFPYITNLVRAKQMHTMMSRPPFESVENPIKMMEAEHQSAGNAMYEIRALSSSYAPPADACTTFKIAYLELQQFELDLHNHVHLENNILFPKAIILESQVFSG